MDNLKGTNGYYLSNTIQVIIQIIMYIYDIFIMYFWYVYY